MSATPTPGGQIAVTWATSGDDIPGDAYIGPLRGFFVRICNDDTQSVLQQYLLGVDRRSMTTAGLSAGTYTVWVAEFNDSGYSGGLVQQHVTVRVSTNDASATPSPSPTPTSSS